MKSIEEKAKAYDEAYKKVAIRFGSNVADEIFLKESEYERIRKELIEFCKNRAKYYPNDPKYKNISAWIAWLEKQSKASKVEQALREVEEKAYAFTEAHKGETSDEILAQMRGEQKPAWKPSEEQMDALHYVTNFDYGGHKATLVSLYEQLKKLRGE